MRHRFGAVRDLILGITVALPDGSVARAGGRVIKNVAGYDLAKLFCGSYGTLGLIVEAVFRLHPAPAATATALGTARTSGALSQAAAAIAAAPLELMCLDVAWHRGHGAVLARAGGSAAREAAEAAGRRLRDAGARVELVDDDDRIWAEQRSGQRGEAGGAVVRVSGVATQLLEVVEVAQALDARLVGRVALGLYWLALAPGDPADMAAAVHVLRVRLAPSQCTLLDAPEPVRAAADPWGVPEGPELALARRLKARFDPGGTCNPGIYVGGL